MWIFHYYYRDLLPSGIRTASLEALVAAYYRTGSTCAVPDLHVWGLAGMLEDLGTSPALVGVCVVGAPSMCCHC